MEENDNGSFLGKLFKGYLAYKVISYPFRKNKNQDTQINIFRDAINNGFTVREIEQIVKDFGDSSYTKTSRKRSKKLPSFEYQKLANDISNKIGKNVKLKVSKSGKGKIEIPFNSNDDLHQIISQLGL